MRKLSYPCCFFYVCIAFCGCAATGKGQSMARQTAPDRNTRQTVKMERRESDKTIWNQMPWASQKNRGRKKAVPPPPAAILSRETKPSVYRVEKNMKPSSPVQQVAWETRLQQLYAVPVTELPDAPITISRLPATTTIR